MTKFFRILIFCAAAALSACKTTPMITEETIRDIIAQAPESEKGVRQVASLWRAEDGTAQEFKAFCKENYIADPDVRRAAFDRVSFYMEGLDGHFNQMALRLRWNTDLDTGPLSRVDEYFSAYDPGAHLSDDLFRNKIALFVALNFPQSTLAEKESLGDDRLAWAYARMGGLFTERIPAEVSQKIAETNNSADIYIASYNIYMGRLRTDDGRQLFPDDMVLLSHWNLRDEIKSNYGAADNGVEKQRMIYRVMKRIIAQDIPAAVVNSPDYEWNPRTNTVTQNGAQVELQPEGAVRYQKILDNFHARQGVDRHTGNTYIDRKFDNGMEIGLAEAEALLDKYLSAPELREVGALIARRLGRPLEAHDIWYDGFKVRSSLDENMLSEQTRRLYPTARAFEKDIPDILVKLGFEAGRAREIGDKIAVDAARGSGHAWGAAMKGQKSHLRTRLAPDGMDYKGYNIAMHELGHNVEQTISLYDVDHYMLSGVPNNSFTEALAFIFQKRDLAVLGVNDNNPAQEALDVLDKAWSLYEISGVSMLDIAMWKWLYANPDATAAQLRDQTIALAKEIWNKYYAPVFGVRDETVLAIYSHMINESLYLPAYAFGQIIEFQLERHLEDRDFASEIDRIYRLGRLTPNAWMQAATGSPVSVEPLLDALRMVNG